VNPLDHGIANVFPDDARFQLIGHHILAIIRGWPISGVITHFFLGAGHF